MSPSVLTVSKFGLNQDIDSGVKEDVWIQGGTKVDETSAEATEIVSSSDSDTSDGTGARTARIFGYDADYNFIQEDVTLNGTTPVTLANEYIDIYRCLITTSGSNNYNVGTITVRHVSGPVTLGVVAAGFNVTQQSHFIIPANYTGFVGQFIAGISGIQGGGGTKVSEISLEYMLEGGPWIRSFTGGFTSETGPVIYDLEAPFVLPEKSRIKLTAIPETNNTKIETIYTVVMIHNDYL